ncbi:hypothetical protein [Pseudodesulfovibrio senegalensis]|uniref:Uncharacterized protein n=1 Tax=Pseudodesulfovibrio senegalensis TaxID=1721087 RepID=A0A6N6N683_9BACT|nr:hypothetical protein [Pseudodesulfovibrio senegalensis]KAB1442989.1 hypothetical protein F8A88_01595 [Pseudodesulfovibrio senegalensis]
MKLEISLLGDYYVVGLMHLDRTTIKNGMRVYGSRDWADALMRMSGSGDSSRVAAEIKERTGRTVRRVYGNSGVVLGGDHFSFEVFMDGVPQNFDKVHENSTRISLGKVTRNMRAKEILGVCRATGIGGITFCWDGVDSFDQSQLVMESHELSHVLNEPNTFKLIFNLFYAGRAADYQRREERDALMPLKHFFHIL